MNGKVLGIVIVGCVLSLISPSLAQPIDESEARQASNFVDDLRKFAQDTKEAFEVENIVAAPIVRSLLDRLTRENPQMAQDSTNDQQTTTTLVQPQVVQTTEKNSKEKSSKEEQLSVEIDGQHHKIGSKFFSLPAVKNADFKSLAGAMGLGALAIGALAATPQIPGILRRSSRNGQGGAFNAPSWLDSLAFWKNKDKETTPQYRYQVPVSEDEIEHMEQMGYNPYRDPSDGKHYVDHQNFQYTDDDSVSVKDFTDKNFAYDEDVTRFSEGPTYYEDYDENVGFRRKDQHYLGAESEPSYSVRDGNQMFNDIQPNVQRDRNNNAYITVDEVNRIANQSLNDILSHYQAFLQRLDDPGVNPPQQRRNYRVSKNPKKTKKNADFNYMYAGDSEEWHPLDKEDAIDPKFSNFLKNHRYQQQRQASNKIPKKESYGKINKESSYTVPKTVYGGQYKSDTLTQTTRNGPVDVVVQNTKTSPSIRVITASPSLLRGSKLQQEPSTRTTRTRLRPSVPSQKRSKRFPNRPASPQNPAAPNRSKTLPSSQTRARNPLVREQMQFQKEYMKRYGQESLEPTGSQRTSTSDFPYEYYRA